MTWWFKPSPVVTKRPVAEAIHIRCEHYQVSARRYAVPARSQYDGRIGHMFDYVVERNRVKPFGTGDIFNSSSQQLHAMPFARDMETELADKFVGMYVNKWTLGYGDRGKRAVKELIERGTQAGLLPGPDTVEFLNED